MKEQKLNRSFFYSIILYIQTGTKCYTSYVLEKYYINYLARGMGGRDEQGQANLHVSRGCFYKTINYNWANFLEFQGKWSSQKTLKFWLRFYLIVVLYKNLSQNFPGNSWKLVRPCPFHSSTHQGNLYSTLLIGCVKFCSRL